MAKITIKGKEHSCSEIVKEEIEWKDVRITPTWFHLDTWNKNSTKGIEVVDLKKVVEVISL